MTGVVPASPLDDERTIPVPEVPDPAASDPPRRPDPGSAAVWGPGSSSWLNRPAMLLGDVALALGGSDDSWTGDLLRLVAKADPERRDLLRLAFPREVDLWLIWQSLEPAPTCGQLLGFLEELDRTMSEAAGTAYERFGKARRLYSALGAELAVLATTDLSGEGRAKIAATAGGLVGELVGELFAVRRLVLGTAE